MTYDQGVIFAILGAVFVLLIWGRWRYDLVAFSALVVAVVAQAVPAEQAFEGFGHPATVIIALVLIVSRGLAGSGAIELIAKRVIDPARSRVRHIAIMGGLAAGLSAVMNNVAALALLMPIDMQAARQAKRRAAATLMPLSFASILGGMITLIGTPPNIIISSFRERSFGEPFAMFDFAPVGLLCALAGLAYIVAIGWRLIPLGDQTDDTASLADVRAFVTELVVKEGGEIVDRSIAEIEDAIERLDAQLLAVLRGGARLSSTWRAATVRAGDIVVVEAAPDVLEPLLGKLGLDYAGKDKDDHWLKVTDSAFAEAGLPADAPAIGRSATGMSLQTRFGVQFLGISRQGRRVTERVRHLRLSPGDLILLMGPKDRLAEAIAYMGALPLAERGLNVIQRQKAGLSVAIFATAILAATAGIVDLPAALAAVAVLYILFGIVPLRDIYTSIEWPVIVLLGAMIPLGIALETSGGTSLIASAILRLADGQSAPVVLIILMIVTMSLSDIINNTATAVIAAPIGVELAARLNVSADPFLMAIAVAASCAFLTPIGHKNNMLVMGPGGYRFGDYWRIGLPLEILIVLVAVPAIMIVWPL